MSGGEQQRLAIARAWALEPEVMFLDEPSSQLDPGATRQIEEIIASLPPPDIPAQARIPKASRESVRERHSWLVHHACRGAFAKLKRQDRMDRVFPWRPRQKRLFSNI